VDERVSGDVEISKRQEILQKHVKTNIALQKTGASFFLQTLNPKP
jgi:hypothetical protein